MPRWIAHGSEKMEDGWRNVNWLGTVEGESRILTEGERWPRKANLLGRTPERRPFCDRRTRKVSSEKWDWKHLS